MDATAAAVITLCALLQANGKEKKWPPTRAKHNGSFKKKETDSRWFLIEMRDKPRVISFNVDDEGIVYHTCCACFLSATYIPEKLRAIEYFYDRKEVLGESFMPSHCEESV